MPEILWAPWRLSYVEKPTTGKADSADIFLDLPAENEDPKNLILYRGKNAFMMMNAFPYTTGHLLIAPFRQVSDVVDLTDAELLEINQLVSKGVSLTRLAFRPDGFNIGVNLGRASGAGIPQHIHWHVVPRWSGDINFMTTVGGVRVMPQSLEEGYQRLARIIADDH
jgi:ATP adenylyltransferase